MSRTLIRQGEGPAAAIIRHHRERTQQRQAFERLLEEAEQAPELDSKRRSRAGSTAAGDPDRLRGIPAVGRSVAGAIPGSSPHAVR